MVIRAERSVAWNEEEKFDDACAFAVRSEINSNRPGACKFPVKFRLYFFGVRVWIECIWEGNWRPVDSLKCFTAALGKKRRRLLVSRSLDATNYFHQPAFLWVWFFEHYIWEKTSWFRMCAKRHCVPTPPFRLHFRRPDHYRSQEIKPCGNTTTSTKKICIA